MNLSVKETALLLHAGKIPNNEILKDQDLLAVITDHVKIGPLTGIEVFESAGWVIEVQVPSRQPRNVKSWERISRGVEQYARHFFLKVLNTKVLKSCFRVSPRAAGDREHRRKANSHKQDIQAMPKPKLVSVGFSQRKRRIIPATTNNKKGL